MYRQQALSWGPAHNPAPPVEFRRDGGYWWAIFGGTLLATPYSMNLVADGQPPWLVIGVMVVSAAAVGAGEGHRGKRFASGRWVLFSLSTLLALLTVWGLPAAAYVAGFYGWPLYVRGRRRRTATRRQRPRRPSAAPGVAGRQPYPVASVAGGHFGTDDHGRTVAASPRGAALVIGPPGSGKTQSVIMPSVAYAPAACVSTSVKTEVLSATMLARQQRGRVWLFDPGGGEPPPGVLPLRWNPLCDVTDWDAARSVAARLAGPARRGDGDHGGDHWLDRAETWLATMLFAARLSADGITSLARWSMAPTASGPEAEAVIIMAREAGVVGADIAETLLSSLLEVPDKERESIASTLSRIMNIYTSSAALQAGRDPNFDAHAFVRSADTVYITAPVDRQRDYAPLIAGFLESLRLAQYHRRQAVDMGAETQTAPVTFVLDEAANTAPIPLPNVASEAGGQGLHLVVAFQDLSQARARWGQAADGFLTLFPEKLILSGMNDRATAEMLSKMSGEYDRLTVAVSAPAPGVGRRNASLAAGYSYNTHRTPVLSIADITGVPPGRGLYWSPRGWQLLTLNPWWQQRGAYGI